MRCDLCEAETDQETCPTCEYIGNHRGVIAADATFADDLDLDEAEEDKATRNVIVAIEGVEMALCNVFFTTEADALRRELARLKIRLLDLTR
jgi:hypothetical protein